MGQAREKEKYDYVNLDQHSYIPIIIQVAGIYFFTLFALIILTLQYNLPLYQDPGTRTPTFWLFILFAYYYLVPFVLALTFALIFRPFWQNFRNLAVVIFLIHGVYSVFIFTRRYYYLESRDVVIQQSKRAHLKVQDFKHQFHVNKANGLIDRVEFISHIDASEFPPGEYRVYVSLSQQGEPLPRNEVGFFKFHLQKDGQKSFRVRFQINPQIYESYFERGEFEVNLGIQRIVTADENGKKILSLSRWSPFLRITSWQGDDSEIEGGFLDLELFEKIDTFFILPIRLKPQLY